MYNLSDVNVAPRKIWNVLEKEIELYEHTEFTAGSDSWLRTFLAFVHQAGLLITHENFVYILKNVFLSQPQFAKYNRDVVLSMDGEHLEASRIPVQLRHVGSANQSRAMRLFRRLAETSELQTGVYADFFQVKYKHQTESSTHISVCRTVQRSASWHTFLHRLRWSCCCRSLSHSDSRTSC